MPSPAQVHWHEGLFLQPHHLQTMQRSLIERIAGERQLAWAYPYGLIEWKLSHDALENLLVRFDKLRLVTPSGFELCFPDNADLAPLDIKRAFEASSEAFTVYLALPLWYASRGNTIEQASTQDWQTKRLYRVAEILTTDENTGENAQPVLTRRLNARLALDGDDLTDMEKLPLLRITHAAGQAVGLPGVDPTFVPACLTLSGSATLREIVRDLANQLDASRKELVSQARIGFSVDQMRGTQVEQVLRLRTLNRYAARLPHLARVPGITPFAVYLDLRELQAELAALNPAEYSFVTIEYDHDNPVLAFNELSRSIRAMLRGVVEEPTLSLAFVKEARFYSATLTQEHLERPAAYYLAIKTKEDSRKVASIVEDANKFKFMPRSIWNQVIYGVKLQETRNPPTELRPQVGVNYFEVDRNASARMWDRIKTEKAVTVFWPGCEASDFELTLQMILPRGAN